MKPPELMAVVPAAGQGLRLGATVPKLFLDVGRGVRIYDVLLARLAVVTRDVHFVLSQEGLTQFERPGRPVPRGVRVTASLQDEARGMGDAVFGASAYWRDARHILIVWGDQLGVSEGTLRRVVLRHCVATSPTMTLPLVHRESPYVHYELKGGTLVRVAQAREGDACPTQGLSDVGTFALTTSGLEAAWQRYLLRPDARGARTGEINLLPLFAYLACHEAFRLNVVEVGDPAESRGVNTPEDLAYFRAKLAGD